MEPYSEEQTAMTSQNRQVQSLHYHYIISTIYDGIEGSRLTQAFNPHRNCYCVKA